MSRSYLSKRQVQFERDSLDYIEGKHKDLISYQDAVHKLWNAENCEHNGPDCTLCQGVRNIVDEQVAWSEEDLKRVRRKVERLERELSRKRRVKRSTKRKRRAARALPLRLSR